MSKRTYGQYCALARAFDVVGERWTPLVLRELAMGPRRYGDLLAGLPGIGTSLLAQRLRELEREGVVRRGFLPPPAARQVYELTEDGHELAAALVPLARWGVKRMGVRRDDESFSLSWMLLFLTAAADTAAAVGVHDVYEFHLDDQFQPDDQFHPTEQVFHVTVDDGRVDARPGPAPRPPDLVIRTDVDAFVAMGGGELDPIEAATSGRMTVEGDGEASRRCIAILRVVDPDAQNRNPTGSSRDVSPSTVTSAT